MTQSHTSAVLGLVAAAAGTVAVIKTFADSLTETFFAAQKLGSTTEHVTALGDAAACASGSARHSCGLGCSQRENALLWGADNARSIIVISVSAGLLPKPSGWVMNSHQGVDRGKTWVSMLRVCDSCSPLNVMASHLKAR
jgi:hypothetical protein